MLANRPALGDFKENLMSVAPGKTIPRSSQKGLKGRSINSFSDSTNLNPIKKPASGFKAGSCGSIISEEKENCKPKFKEPVVKAEYHAEEDSWPEIEKMHIYVEPEDDYEDILPKHERIQKQDLDSLFFNYSIVNFTELTVDKPPSPLKECETLDIEMYSPVIPDIKASLYDDSELEYIALQDDFLTY